MREFIGVMFSVLNMVEELKRRLEEERADKFPRLGIIAPREISVHRQEVYELVHGRNEL